MSQANTWIRRYPVPNYHFGPRCHVDGIPPFGHRRMPMPKEKDKLHDGFSKLTASADTSTAASTAAVETWTEATPSADTSTAASTPAIETWTEATPQASFYTEVF